jgi:predicted phage terminase large subunit-like protein
MPVSSVLFRDAARRHHVARPPALAAVPVPDELAADHLRDFARAAWPYLEPTTPLRWGWALDAICEHLEAVSRGWIRDLIINVPPGMAKSLTATVFWPAWEWIDHPERRWVFAAHSMGLALRDAVKCRTLIESTWYQSHFTRGAWLLSDDQNAKSYYANTKTGFRMCTSPDARTTGHRGDRIVIDDPIDARIAVYSKAERDAVLAWWDNTMSNRLNDQETGARVIIMQRLHEDDLSGHLIRKGGWTHLRLPMEFEPATRCVTYVRKPDPPSPAPAKSTSEVVLEGVAQVLAGEEPAAAPPAPALGPPETFWQDPRTAPGELLFPERFPRHRVEEEKKGGSARYAGQYQQRPMPAEGGLFKRSWWRYWRFAHEDPIPALEDRTVVLPDHFDDVTGSWDCAFKKTSDSDKVAGGTWGRLGASKFLLELFWERASFTDTVREVRAQADRRPEYLEILIEDKANGPAVINVLYQEVSRLIAVDPEGGKEARAAATSPEVEAGNVYLPLHAPWRDAYVEEHAAFPRGSKDDAVDQQSQFLIRVKTRAKPAGHDEMPDQDYPQSRVAAFTASTAHDEEDDDLDDELGDSAGGRRI